MGGVWLDLAIIHGNLTEGDWKQLKCLYGTKVDCIGSDGRKKDWIMKHNNKVQPHPLCHLLKTGFLLHHHLETCILQVSINVL